MDFSRRNAILIAINKVAAIDDKAIRGQNELLKKCCQIIMENQEYCLIWVGKRNPEKTKLIPLVTMTSAGNQNSHCLSLAEQVIRDMNKSNPAVKALLSGTHVVCNNVLEEHSLKSLHNIALITGFRSYASWPLLCREKEFGVINIHSESINCFNEEEVSFLNTIISDISLALYSQEMTEQMQIERDFNKEIVDTVQALLVSVSPCGNILSFNQTAERITGFKESEVIDHYWVDFLMAPEHRILNQQMLSSVLKGEEDDLNFESFLLTKDNQTRIISWHGSFRKNIDKGKVGLVLLGIDKTGQIQIDQDLNQAIAQWENIFSAIQDPALIVSDDSIILDANLATFTAARKNRAEVIGHNICDILHKGRSEGKQCPLEELIKSRVSRHVETELRGLMGNYLLTVSPLNLPNNHVKATLLVARDLTEEEQMKAEAIRAAQLASVGELAAGVAHEINNPINGIINYAQIILDDPTDEDSPALLNRIIKEGKRIASIVSNLLDFSSRREDSPEATSMRSIIESCLELMHHQFQKDCIILTVDLPDNLPYVYCNGKQIQQVLLNLFSNARYALNERFPTESDEKRLVISGETIQHNQNKYIRITITDFGTGIKHDTINRVFDPFYSTKAKGEGTGLGLSISYGLVQDNNGFLRINSEDGVYTSLSLDLPEADL